MPINPSIIGNVMAPQAVQMPDVNAMLQTQTQGMENTFKIEAARQAAAKEEAATLKKEQEAATIKALLPAYTYGLQTGDIEGALNLAPPEMRDGLMPYVEALRGKSPEEVQAALYGSLSASPEGQEALAAIQRSQTYGVQRGQLEVSQARLDLDRQEAEREAAEAAKAAASGNKVVQWVTDDAGNVTGLDAQGNIVVTQPGIGKKTVSSADVKTAAQLETEKKQTLAKTRLDQTITKMADAYKKLDELKAITSTKRPGAENVAAYLRGKTGAIFGTPTGAEDQTQRQIIKNLRFSLINDVKEAAGMSSKALDSNVELKNALESLGDPENQSFEAAMGTLAEILNRYGSGEINIDAGVSTPKTNDNTTETTAPNAIPQIMSDEEYDALPSGTVYIAPDGQQRTKR